MLCVHAHTQSLIVSGRTDDGCDLREAPADSSACSCGVFDQDLGAWFASAQRCGIQCSDECLGNAVNYRIHSRAEMAPNVQDDALCSKTCRDCEMTDETLEGFLLEDIVAGRKIDQVARVTVRATDGWMSRCSRSKVLKNLIRRRSRFPLARTERKDLD